jgi:oligo-1,6-glucosidase
MILGKSTVRSERYASAETAERAPWWARSVVYQVYPRSFADSDGDGVGDLRGLLSKVDYLHWLGVDVVWLSPVYPSPQRDNGYDITDYYGIDPVYGTLADLDDLVAALHARGMKLVMDLVVNHTSDEHPWFVEARSERDSARRDWYWWRPARPGATPGARGAEPNDWTAAFSGPAWTLDESGEYYLHLFSPHQPDLNWENPSVRAEIHRMMRWWLDRGVDGFRMDVINLVSKDVALPDAGLDGDASRFYACGPRLFEFLTEMADEVFDERDEVLAIGEMPFVGVDDARRFTDLESGPLSMVFQFEHVDLGQGPLGKFDPRPIPAGALADSLERWQTGLARSWNSLYLSNHDQPRSVSRFGDDGPWRTASAKALATMLHLHRGTPFVYQGEEIALANVPWTGIDELRDIESLNHFRTACAEGRDPREVLEVLRSVSRDNARTPMPWDATANGGFTTGTPWIAASPDHVTINVEAQRDDPDSVLNHYRRLIALRREDPCIAWGDYTRVRVSDPRVYTYTRTLDGTAVHVLVNLSSDVVTGLTWPPGTDWSGSETVLASHPAGPAAPPDTVEPWQFEVRRTRSH